jgi:hypothetical protein
MSQQHFQQQAHQQHSKPTITMIPPTQQQQQHQGTHQPFHPHLPHLSIPIPHSQQHIPGHPQQAQPPASAEAIAATPAANHSHLHQANKKKKRVVKTLEDSVLVTQIPDEETVTGQIKNREAIKKIRDAWIFKQIRNRQQEFTQYRTVRVRPLSFVLQNFWNY